MEINRVTVPIFEIDAAGAIIPNTLFHRSFDYVHSRCVEYPFAASQVTGEGRLLDVGSVKADKVWIDWLESLPLEVHATDYDADSLGLFKKSQFQQADVRQLAYPDNHFDVILAVSVIEHIGLGFAQVLHETRPSHAAEGDIAAVAELLRVLKPNGRLVMTFPYSSKAAYTEQLKTARIYGEERLARFNALAQPETLDYYEYQYLTKKQLFVHPSNQKASVRQSLKRKLRRFLPKKAKATAEQTIEANQKLLHGLVTWRRLERNQGAATNQQGHIDGVICGVWRKTESSQE